MISAITGFIEAVVALRDIVNTAKAIIAFIEANKEEQWFKDSAKAFRVLQEAKTPEDRRDAAKRMRDLLRGLP